MVKSLTAACCSNLWSMSVNAKCLSCCKHLLFCHPAKSPCHDTLSICRFHNIYGPYGTWKGGREKAPAAFCRKALTSTKDIEMWGDGKQTRSFTYIDDCVEGILRITKSDFKEPLNLGSSEMVSMNGMMETICQFDSKKLPIRWGNTAKQTFSKHVWSLCVTIVHNVWKVISAHCCKHSTLKLSSRGDSIASSDAEPGKCQGFCTCMASTCSLPNLKCS